MGDTERTRLRQQFDHLAADYQRGFDQNPLACWARSRAWALYEDELPPPPAHVLDLGCGVGDDALHLARNGHLVTALDFSTEMLTRAQQRAQHAGLSDRIHTAEYDLLTLGPPPVGNPDPVQAAIFGFGVLNCIPNIRDLLCWLRDKLPKRGGVVVSSLSNRCLSDVLWQLIMSRQFSRRWNAHQLVDTIGSVNAPE